MKNLHTPHHRLFPRLLAALFLLGSGVAFGADAATGAAASSTAASNEAANRIAVQITEIGCMRALLVLDEAAFPFEKQIAQRLTDVDFRLFPSARTTGSRFNSAQAKAFAKTENADLILYATVSAREKTRIEDFRLYEGDATVQVWGAVSGELLATHTARETGRRTTDVLTAERGAIERSLDVATEAAIKKSLAKAHKILAHEAVIVNVFSESALLAIMEYMGRMEGVYHVRRLAFDRQTNEALIEIIGSPRSETFWRAYLEKMPKTQVVVQLTPNKPLHDKYPSWFLTTDAK